MTDNRSLICIFVLTVIFAAAPVAQDCCTGIRGNIDGDPGEEITISDLVYLTTYMFQGGPVPECPEEADINGDGAGPDISDLVDLVSYMFQGGPPPADCPVVVPDTFIVPLAIGNNWTSHFVEYDASGSVVDSGLTTTLVIGDSIINDSTWYLISDSTTFGDSSLWTNMDDGLWSWSDTTTPNAYLALKYPATAGESYPLFDPVTVTVESTNASVTVPAGTFECYYYRMHVPIYGTIGRVWAAPNVGVVKGQLYELTLFSTYLRLDMELESWELVGP